MQVKFKVKSDHFSWDDPAIGPAIRKYTSPLWPLGRTRRAQQQLEKEQEKLLEKHGIKKISKLGSTILKVDDVETKKEARDKIQSFKEDLEHYYREEFALDEEFIVAIRDRI